LKTTEDELHRIQEKYGELLEDDDIEEHKIQKVDKKPVDAIWNLCLATASFLVIYAFLLGEAKLPPLTSFKEIYFPCNRSKTSGFSRRAFSRFF
jgi:hypothetical protein